MKKIIAVDFSGTLVRSFVAEKANEKRFEILGIPLPDKDSHKRMHADKSHYQIIKDALKSRFPVDSSISYTSVKSSTTVLSGDDVRTLLMTDLFRDGMYAVALEYKENIFTPGILDALLRAKEQGYGLVIVSGVRTDIISGMLALAHCPVEFDRIIGQDPILSIDDNDISLDVLSKEFDVAYMLGDKSDDLKAGRRVGAKTVWVKSSHSRGDELDFADIVISEEKDFKNLF